jgi:GT2 family glycosyltransferase
MSAEPTEVSVIVVNWNGGDALQTCLRSVAAATQGRRADVWLVDNASSDGSCEGAACSFPTLHLIRNAGNLGFAGAANQALSRAVGKYLLLLNPDAQITAEALSRMLAAMRASPRIGIAGCGSVDSSGRQVPAFEPSFPGQRARQLRNVGDDASDVAWVSGACLMAKREMADEIGLLDPRFFMYYEDVDWCYRAWEAGWRVVTVPAALIRHELGGSSAEVPPGETARRTARSRLLFYRKHYSAIRARWLACRMLASALAGLLQRLVPALFRRKARECMREDWARLRVVLTGGRQKEVPQ